MATLSANKLERDRYVVKQKVNKNKCIREAWSLIQLCNRKALYYWEHDNETSGSMKFPGYLSNYELIKKDVAL
jgi:hypothetical protein